MEAGLELITRTQFGRSDLRAGIWRRRLRVASG